MTTLQDMYSAGLSVLSLRSVYTNILQTQPPYHPDDDVPAEHSWLLWVAVLLKRVRPELSSEQQLLVLQSLKSTSPLGHLPPNLILTFLDGKAFTHTGLHGFVRLDSGEMLLTMPYAFVVSVAYNVPVFIQRQTSGLSHAALEANAGIYQAAPI